jgi:large subunit ribosomal protein L15
MPLQRRIPKRGFTPLAREEFQVVNLRDLAGVEESEINPDLLAGYRMIRSAEKPVKLLAIGEAPKGISITVDAASKTARDKVEAAGGTIVIRSGPVASETED